MENLCDGQVEGGSAGTAGSFCCLFYFFYLCTVGIVCYEPDRILIDFYKILKAVLQNFALFFGLNVLGILLAACISKVFCRFVTAAELVVLLTLYVQGNFLVNHMPPSTARKSYGRTTGEKI